MAHLKRAGYPTFRLRDEKLMSESTIQKLRNGEMISMSTLDTICALLGCQPDDVIGYSPTADHDFIVL